MSDRLGGFLVFGGAGLVVLSAGAYLLVESFLLLTDRTPITNYVRQDIARYPKAAAAVAFLAGLLAGHFWR